MRTYVRARAIALVCLHRFTLWLCRPFWWAVIVGEDPGALPVTYLCLVGPFSRLFSSNYFFYYDC